MSFIIDYSKNIESKTEDIETDEKSIDSSDNDSYNSETDEISIETIKPIKKKLSAKKLEALAKARIQATIKIKEKNIKYKQLQSDKEKEETDIIYIQEKYEYFKNKIDTYHDAIKENTTKHIKPEVIRYKLTEDDRLLAQMLDKY